MKGFILAAGFGSRMKDLTSNCPKALLHVAGYPLIYYSLYTLYKLKVKEVIINLHYLGNQIKQALRDFPYFPIHFSTEEELLETAGGIRLAMHTMMKPDEPFILINPDTIFMFETQNNINPLLDNKKCSYLFVKKKDNSSATGLEFVNDTDVLQFNDAGSFYYTGLAMMNTTALAHLRIGTKFPLGKLWRKQADDGLLRGKFFSGKTIDAGTKLKYEKIQHTFPYNTIEKKKFQDFIDVWKKNRS